ncbi:MAG: hypothetical protein ABIE74_09075 [Pseudomonadota bacterium]
MNTKLYNEKLQGIKPKGDASIPEYLSFVRHELRSNLFVIKESISQVLDGLYGDDKEKINKSLNFSMEYSENIKLIADSLLSDEAILKLCERKAQKMKYKVVQFVTDSIADQISNIRGDDDKKLIDDLNKLGVRIANDLDKSWNDILQSI